MGFVLGFVAACLAGIFELAGAGRHGKAVVVLLIVGLALACAEGAWGWHRGGRYRRPGV